MLSDGEKAEFRALLVEVATTEMRSMVVGAVGSAFAESERLMGERFVAVQRSIDDVVDRLDVIEADVRATRLSLARSIRTKERLERDLDVLRGRVDELEK